MARTEIRFAGFGGQGVVMAGILLGRAAVVSGDRYALQTQSYGAAARGGAVRSDVILDDRQIVYPRISALDVLVVLSNQAAERYLGDLKTGGLLVIDEDLVSLSTNGADACDFRLSKLNPSRMAGDLFGRSIYANLIIVGYVVRRTELLRTESVEEAIRATVPPATLENNLQAFHAGLELE